MIKNILLGMSLLCSILTFAQNKPHLSKIQKSDRPYQAEEIKPLKLWQGIVPPAGRGIIQSGAQRYGRLSKLTKPDLNGSLQVIKDAATGLPIFIKGAIKSADQEKADLEAQSYAYLEAVQEILQIEQPGEEFQLQSIENDQLGQTHLRFRQIYKGIPVYTGELILHAWDGQVQSLNGRYFPTPELSGVQPIVSKETAIQNAFQHLSKKTQIKQLTPEQQRLINGKQAEAALVIYHPNKDANAERLTWEVNIHADVVHRWTYFVDAKTGQVLHTFTKTCNFYHDHASAKTEETSNKTSAASDFFPPRTATATDLQGVTRTINTFLEGNTYFLLDASREMFNAVQSQIPDQPIGAIFTLDANNLSYASDTFSAFYIASANNTWGNPNAVSAHYNAGTAYEYFRQTFNRNSINGSGGNIISVINVADENGEDMDNAFWNGIAMFYGNGDLAFNRPLAQALDVAGHEMSHGVIENTANLEYQDEPGALNESFADIFGAMIDRDDWKIGEDVVNPQFFPTGALRDMQNPNNGGNAFGDRGWQPAHVSEQYRGSQDNGGVHINSGIPNRAYYLFATEIGKAKAEQIFYRALANYLVRSSRFIDLRIAVLQAATDLHGANAPEVNAAAAAFDAVGILAGQGGNYQNDLNQNPGQEFILYANGNQTTLNIVTPTGSVVAAPLTNIGPASKPSITDDGSVVVYIAADQTMRGVLINWDQGTAESITVSDQPIWRGVAISKDGTRLAALTNDYSNSIYIFDLLSSTGDFQEFRLFNPTYTEGISTGDVAYADALEWDFTSEFVMYDALSVIRSNVDSLTYWDIGFLRAWNNAASTFGDGYIDKLFTGLPENVSVGNPTFAKNSPYIIAFDYVDFFNEEYIILGANVETGEVGGIFQNSDLSFPNYSVQDDQLIFDGFAGFAGDRVVGVVDLANDKINALTDPPSATVLVSGDFSGARWGIWFANGERVLTDNQTVKIFDESLKIFPNPFEEIIYLRGELPESGLVQMEVFDPYGRLLQKQQFSASSGNWQESLSLRNIPAGTYVIRVSAGTSSASRKVIKLK